MPSPLRAHVLSLIVLAASLAIIPGSARAAKQPFAITVQPANARGMPLHGPGYFVLRMTPGESHRNYALVTNRGRRALTVDIAPVDAAHDIYGNISYRLQQAPRRQVGAWVRLFSRTLYLRRRESVVVPFTITLPRQLRSGTYIGALTFFPTIHSSQGHGRAVVNVQVRLADAIVITVHPRPRRGVDS